VTQTTATIQLTTILGRIVAALRLERRLSQAELAKRIGWERSLLARVEVGRNLASVDNIYEIEQDLIGAGQIRHHGDLVYLAHLALEEARRRGFVPIYGTLRAEDPIAEADNHIIDRIVARVLDDWNASGRG
jgi:transcriptional regulator with XRE-family HTH domain